MTSCAQRTVSSMSLACCHSICILSLELRLETALYTMLEVKHWLFSRQSSGVEQLHPPWLVSGASSRVFALDCLMILSMLAIQL